MHELSRRAYLESMGIDSYVSRVQLPGAAPTRRLVVSRRLPASGVSTVGQASISSAPVASSTAAAFNRGASEVKAKLGETNGAAAVKVAAAVVAPVSSDSVPAFSIVAIVAGGFLWIEDLPHSAVSRDQLNLIRAMIKALDLESAELDISQFDWPMHNNSQLDLGEDAARAGLGGFIQRKIDQGQCRGLIFLGSSGQQKLDTTQLELGLCITTVSTLNMLHKPALKKQAWLDLQPLVTRS